MTPARLRIVLAAILASAIILGGAAWERYRQVRAAANDCSAASGYFWCAAKRKCVQQREEYCTAAAPKTAVFTCEDSKIITAAFYPKDDKYVDLVLSDGRKVSVPRAVSASGARYATPDESFVFWNKGNTAVVIEKGATTFSSCVTNAP